MLILILHLRRDLVINRLDLHLIAFRMLADIITIKVQNTPFDSVYLVKVIVLDKCIDSLRHSTNDQVLPEQIHRLAMQRLSERRFFSVAVADKIHHRVVPVCPQELLKVQRIHIYMIFLGRDQDILYIFTDGNK